MSAALALIDSSAWIEVLCEQADATLHTKIQKALHDGVAAISAPIWVELYRGVRGKREMAQLESLRKLCRWLEFDAACWEATAKIARACRERGATVPLGDLLVFACAERHKVEIIERDQHFGMIAKATRS